MLKYTEIQQFSSKSQLSDVATHQDLKAKIFSFATAKFAVTLVAEIHKWFEVPIQQTKPASNDFS